MLENSTEFAVFLTIVGTLGISQEHGVFVMAVRGSTHQLLHSAPDDQIFDWTCAPMGFTSVLNIQTFMLMSWSHTVHTITSSGHPRSEITWCWTDGHIMH